MTEKQEKAERLAAALRDNLKRRKTQARNSATAPLKQKGTDGEQ